MRACLKLAAMLLLSTLAVAQEKAAAPKLGSVSGMVLSTTNDPVRRATVTLETTSGDQADEERSERLAAITDDTGRFSIAKVPPGQYALMVEKPGYSTPRRYQRGATITIAAGQDVRDQIVRLAATAAIRGKVVDENGEPLEHVSVPAVVAMSNRGRRVFQPINQATTDDHGEFRIYGLPPGNYYVVAFYAGAGGRVYAPSYYPGTATLESAQKLHLASGEEATANFSLSPTRSFAVRGRVTGAAPDEQVTVYAAGASDQLQIGRRVAPGGGGGPVRKDGTFEMKPFLPGKYVIHAASAAPEDEEQRNSKAASQVITVADTDVEGIELKLHTAEKPLEIKGEIRLDGAAPKSGFAGLHILLQPAERGEADDGMSVEYYGGFGEVAKDGTFTLEAISRSKMYASLIAQSGGWEDYYLKAVRVGGQDVTRSGFRVTPAAAASKMELVIASDGARVEGTVLDQQDKPVANVAVVGIPERALRENMSFYQHAITDQNGRFVMRGVAPGDYTIVSAEDLDPAMFADPDEAAAHQAEGHALHAEKNGRHSLVVRFIPESPQ